MSVASDWIVKMLAADYNEHAKYTPFKVKKYIYSDIPY